MSTAEGTTVSPQGTLELRAWAEQILISDSVATKLAPVRPALLTDSCPGPAVRLVEPTRPANLQFAPRRSAPNMPPASRFNESRQRGIAHHIMANHELQALEVMAWVLLAFPDAPAEYRRGMATIMQDEQRHTRMHIERAAALDVPFGSLPVNCYIWKKAQSFGSLLDYVAGLPLTFEGANLDHSLQFEQWFLEAGDRKGAAVMRQIHHDEIEHVAFGWKWLRLLKPEDATEWQTYCAHLTWPLRPEKSMGDLFSSSSRLAAGMTPEFILELENSREGNAKPAARAQLKDNP